MALSVKNRLSKKRDFDTVFKRGKAIKGSFLFIKIGLNSSQISRFGFSISSKASKKAVTRNKIRRALSELIRLNISKIGGGYDIIVVVNNGKTDMEELKDDLEVTLNKAGVVL